MGMVNVGDIFPNNVGEEATVIEVGVSPFFLIRYNDETQHEQFVKSGNLTRGKFKNCFSPSVFGVGYIGSGKFTSSKRFSRAKTLEYQAWKDMLKRCYSEKSLLESPQYRGCTVHPEWHNFQIFAEWYTTRKWFGLGYQLDKDLLYKGNKEYSQYTCCLIPPEVNSALICKPLIEGKDTPTGIVTTPSGRFAVSVRGLLGGSYIGTYSNLEDAISARKAGRRLRFQQLVEKYEEVLSSEVKSALLNWVK